MALKHRIASMLLLSALIWSESQVPSLCATEGTSVSPPSLEEISSKRKAVREKLMTPSLEGIRGLSYGVVGFENPDQREKEMAEKLRHLGVPIFSGGELKDGVGPVDAMMHVHFMKLSKSAMAELTVSQWVTLVRSPKTKVRAVTYRNRVFVPAANGEQAIAELADQFVSDFQKANKKPVATGGKKSASKAKAK